MHSSSSPARPCCTIWVIEDFTHQSGVCCICGRAMEYVTPGLPPIKLTCALLHHPLRVHSPLPGAFAPPETVQPAVKLSQLQRLHCRPL